MSKINEWLFGSQVERNENQAKDTYQVKEYDGKLWLTYNCALICPTDMFSEKDPIQVLTEIRKLFVERNTTSHDTGRD